MKIVFVFACFFYKIWNISSLRNLTTISHIYHTQPPICFKDETLDNGWPESEEKYIEICNCGGRRALHRKEEIHDKVSKNTELCWNRVSMYL